VETFTIKNLSFSYPEYEEKVIDNLSLSVKKGEFLVLCGPSGCGKSTLLRQLKSSLAPHGRLEGEILFEGKPLKNMDLREQSQKIGFVLQSPENQIVTDKVWHELAFGLESLGYDTPTIRQRVAEMASYFGIQEWFYKDVNELSGGQKQILNLASVMAMQPSVLILDEPTSQLDPIAAAEFISTVGKINYELGTTVIMTEHRLEEAFLMTESVAVMDKGRLICKDSVRNAGKLLKNEGHAMFLAMPAAMRIWAATDTDAECPITVRDGKDWLLDFAKENEIKELKPEVVRKQTKEDIVIKADDVWFKYEKDGKDIVKGLSFEVEKGELLALLGGNGTGKSTSMKLVAGLLKAYRGDIKINGKLGVLPQNPQTLFVKKTVRLDLFEIMKDSHLSQKEKEERVAQIVKLCRLEGLLDRHPYDLSGGEQQRAALAKVMLLNPDILLLDEPTKGLDAEFKIIFAEILQVLLKKNVTVFMVSHDIEFCAKYAHRCALFFDGNIVTENTPRKFFSGNNFYTTAANRMARDISAEAVTVEDVINICGGTVEKKVEIPNEENDDFELPKPAKNSKDWKPTKLPWWRKIIAAVSGLIAVTVMLSSIGATDLSSFVDSSGITNFAEGQLSTYTIMFGALAIMALAIGRRSAQPAVLQTPKEKRRLTKRTLLATALILILIPVTLFIGVYYFGDRKYYFVSLLILIETMLPFFMVFEGRKPQARELVLIAVICAIGVAGRAAFFMLPEFKPVVAIVIIAGVAFGGETGFLVGAITMLVSNMMFSQGPWTPWQMFAMGIIGFTAGVLFRKGLLRRSKGALCIFGAFASIVIFGGIMNPASALMWTQDINWKIIMTYFITGFPVDCVRAAATVFFLWFAAEPMLEKLDRIKVKYGLVE